MPVRDSSTPPAPARGAPDRDERVVEVLTFYANLAKDNVIWNPLNPSPSWPGDDLVAGRAGFIRYGY